MCRAFSALVLRNGELIFKPEYTHSHEDLIDDCEVPDDGKGRFVRVEYAPKNGDYTDITQYTLSVDQWDVPEWFADHRKRITAQLRKAVKKMLILDGRRKALLGGCWIVGPNANIKRAVNCFCITYQLSRIVALGSSRVEARGSSSVESLGSSSVVARESSRVVARGSSSVVARGSSSVVAWELSSVEARESSSVEARDSSRIEAWDSSRVEAWDSSRVESLGSSSVVDHRMVKV